MFDDIKDYGNYGEPAKTCALCNDGRPLRTYTTCDGCAKYFCLSHRPPFQDQWFCPNCESNFKNFIQPLKEANVYEFFKRIA